MRGRFFYGPKPPPLPRGFFFNDTATTEIYTLSLHDALPICQPSPPAQIPQLGLDLPRVRRGRPQSGEPPFEPPTNLEILCRLLLVKKWFGSGSHDWSFFPLFFFREI